MQKLEVDERFLLRSIKIEKRVYDVRVEHDRFRIFSIIYGFKLFNFMLTIQMNQFLTVVTMEGNISVHHVFRFSFSHIVIYVGAYVDCEFRDRENTCLLPSDCYSIWLPSHLGFLDISSAFSFDFCFGPISEYFIRSLFSCSFVGRALVEFDCAEGDRVRDRCSIPDEEAKYADYIQGRCEYVLLCSFSDANYIHPMFR